MCEPFSFLVNLLGNLIAWALTTSLSLAWKVMCIPGNVFYYFFSCIRGAQRAANYGVKSLLCLATGVHEDGSPILNAFSLCCCLPIRLFAQIKNIRGIELVISFLDDSRDQSDFKLKMDAFYPDPDNHKEVHINDIKISGTYVCRYYGNNFERCRLEVKHNVICRVYLVDIAKHARIKPEDIFYIFKSFRGRNLDYAFVLSCNAPTADFLEALNLLILKGFSVNGVVEVVICSLKEPCLALLGSISNQTLHIRPETVIGRLSDKETRTWQKNFSDYEPSLNSVISKQYPLVSPLSSNFSLSTVLAFVPLEKVYVRDIWSSICLSYLQKMINHFYNDTKFREQMQFSGRAEHNAPCVVFDKVSNQYIRGKVLNGDFNFAIIIGVNYPDIMIRGLALDYLYHLSDRFNFQLQYFPIRLVDIDNLELLSQYSGEAKDILPIGSVVSAATYNKDTLVTVKFPDDTGLLHKIDFFSKGDYQAVVIEIASENQV